MSGESSLCSATSLFPDLYQETLQHIVHTGQDTHRCVNGYQKAVGKTQQNAVAALRWMLPPRGGRGGTGGGDSGEKGAASVREAGSGKRVK